MAVRASEASAFRAKPELASRRVLWAAELLDAMENQLLNEVRRLLRSRLLSVAFVARFSQQGTRH